MGAPLFTSLRRYRTAWLRGDAVAGLTGWAVLVPEALAYATIAGVSPVVGLYAAPGASRPAYHGTVSQAVDSARAGEA